MVKKIVKVFIMGHLKSDIHLDSWDLNFSLFSNPFEFLLVK